MYTQTYLAVNANVSFVRKCGKSLHPVKKRKKGEKGQEIQSEENLDIETLRL